MSSRIDRQPESWVDWFRALRSLCAQLDADTERLIVAEGTTTAPYAERATELFGKRSLRICVEQSRTIEAWWQFVQSSHALPNGSSSACSHSGDSSSIAEVFVSPAVGEEPEGPPARDVLIHALAKRLIALHVSPNGNVAQLMEQRLRTSSIPANSTRLLLSDRTNVNVTDRLLSQGCVGWHLQPQKLVDASEAESISKVVSETDSQSPRSSGIEKSRRSKTREKARWSFSLEVGEWLTHCTRRRVGPWPNQSPEEHVDELLLEHSSADHSPQSALQRIVSQSRLIASNEAVRGSADVVCFTAVNLDELSSLRVFRPHRGRWDFEPYGLCISKRWLIAQGARAVRYATHVELKTISAADQPYYQLQASHTSSGNVIDWTVEEEWRIVGDVDLSSAAPDEVVVFVPTEQVAANLSKLTNWRVAHQILS